MKILIRKSDNVVIYAQHDLILDTEAHGEGWRDPNFNAQNAVLTDAELPPLWIGAVWAYHDGTWTVVDTNRHTEIVAAAEVVEAQRLAIVAAKEELALDQISKKSYTEIETYIRGVMTGIPVATVDLIVKMGKLIKALVDR